MADNIIFLLFLAFVFWLLFFGMKSMTKDEELKNKIRK